MDDLVTANLLLHAAASLYMVGLIWFVQVVHYPLLDSVGRDEFPAYERKHISLTTWVVAPPMLVEGATAAGLLFLRPSGVPLWLPVAGAVLLAVAWLSTFLVQVPCHTALEKSFDFAAHRRLVRTNWIRTAVWSLHGVLVLVMFWFAWKSP